MNFENSLRNLRSRQLVFAIWRTISSPISLSCLVAFLLAVGLSWLVSSRVSRRGAEETLLAAAADMSRAIDNCVDELLFYEGHAIVNHYRTPEAMADADMAQILRQYNIDELSVANSNGVAVADSLSGPGFDFSSSPESAKFNCLLHGVDTYSQPFRGAAENNGVRRKYAGVAFPLPARGFVQLGFDETRVKDGIDFWFADLAVGRHIGESGYYVIAKEESGIVDSSGRYEEVNPEIRKIRSTLKGIGFDRDLAPAEPNEFFVMSLYGEDCLCLTEVRSHHRVITALPMAEVSGGSLRLVFATSLILFAVFVMVVAFMTRLTRLVDQLRVFIAAEQERQQKDLELARTIQTSSLSTVFPSEADYAIKARMVTAREVGGDFYDFCTLSDGRVFLLVADVSGKGVPAALFMMRAKATIRSAIENCPDDLAAAVAMANSALAESNEANMFVTCWIAIYDRTTRALAYVNAGHNPPLVRHADGTVEWLRSRGGLVIAAMGGVKFRTHTLTLQPGDELFTYTDGVTEAMNGAAEQYGEPRLERSLAAAAPAATIDAVLNDIRAFVAGAEQSDDITILTLALR